MTKISSRLYFIALVSSFLMLLMIGLNEKKDVFEVRDSLNYVTVEEYDCYVNEDSAAPVGVTKIYEWNLPDTIKGDDSLAFYFVHQYIRVFLDDELVFSAFPSNGHRIGQTLGGDWAVVPLLCEDGGKAVRIEIIPAYKATLNRELQFFMGSRLGIFLAQAHEDKWQIIMSLISIIVGVVFFVIAYYYLNQRKEKKDLLYMGMFSMMLGLWRLTDTRFLPLLFHDNETLMFYLSVTMLMLGSVPLLRMLRPNIYEKNYHLIDVVCGIFSVICIILVMIQFLGIADIREMLIVIHIMILLSVLISIGLVIYDRLKVKDGEKKGILWICAIGAILDIIEYYVKGNSSGLAFSLAAFQIYILCAGILAIKEHLEWEKRISEQEAAMAESKVSIMLSQIQPHFLYNSLTSIYYLCAKDSEAARRAIKDFADYLRGNMDSLKQKTPVPFETELRHVEVYLSLEKMRFDEELQIKYDIQTKDFSIPSLTVQPLVENAVKYGVGKSPDGGTVNISTRENKDCYEVIVTDNGVGYDPDKTQDDGRTHIGIDNVRSRLWGMSHATLDIVSVEGEGTTATIRIPKQIGEK